MGGLINAASFSNLSPHLSDFSQFASWILLAMAIWHRAAW